MWTQDNYRSATRRAAAVAAVILALAPVSAGTISSGTSNILAGDPPGPCAQAAAGAGYVAGVDATGNAVEPADLPGSTAPLPAGKVVYVHPRSSQHGHGNDVEVPIDLGSVAPPSCDARTTHNH